MNSAKSEIAGLDLLRFVCALLVLSFHLGLWCFASGEDFIGTSHGAFGSTLPAVPLLPFAKYGWIGVQIFFVLSGFIIPYSSNGSSLSRFLKSRIIRLLPALWICATITAALYVGSDMYGGRAILNAYLRSIILFPVAPWIDGVYWTLIAEITFYGVVAILLLTNTFRKIETVFSVIGLISAGAWAIQIVLARSSFFPSFIGRSSSIQFGSIFDDFMSFDASRMNMLGYGCFFATGVLLWVGTARGFTLSRIAVIAAISVGCVINILNWCSLTDTMTIPVWPAIALYGAAISFLVVSVKFNDRFSHYNLRGLGLATYPLYLLHNIPGSYLFGRVLLPHMSAGSASLLSASLCVGVAFTVTRPLEKIGATLLRKAIGDLAECTAFNAAFVGRMGRSTTTVE